MKYQKYERKGSVITTLSQREGEPPSKKDWKTVNKAKKESRKLQIAEGGLGCGVLRVA